MASEARAEIPTDVMQAVVAGRKIEAIKRLREQTGMGLMEAKEVVDSLAYSEDRFSAHHPAAPRNDTGVGRFVAIMLVLSVVVASYLLLQD